MPDDHAIDARTVLDTGRANQHDRWSQGSGSAAERIGARIVVPEAARSFDASADDTFFAIGSCFARNVEERLEQAGAAVSSRRIAVEGLGHQAAREGGVFNKYTPLSILQELRWAAGTEPYPEAALLPAGDQLYDPYLSPKAERGDVATLMARRDQIRAYFAQAFEADIVVLTLGLIETWIDRETGLTLNDAPLPRLLARNPDRFAFRRLELEDCEAALEESLALLRAHGKAGQRVVITVSPVPLGRTFTGEDVIVANTLSKATLRVAAQRVIARHDGVDYFPSFEAVTMSDPELAWRGDRRHVGEFIVGRIIGTFLDRYGIAPKSASGDAAEDPALDDGQEADPKDALIGQLTRQVNRYKNGIILLQRDIRQMRAAEDDAKEAVVPKPGDNEDDSRQSALGRS
ncbi:MAG: GSCFA domain-containing protein, partial [Pseudooceanicola atlanticus]